MKIAEVRELSDKELAERLDADKKALNQMVLNHRKTKRYSSFPNRDSSTRIKK